MTHIPGHIGTAGGGETGDLIGVKLFRTDGTFAGRLVQDPDKGLILKNEFGFAKFQGGTYLLEAGFTVTVNAQGDIITKEGFPTGDTGRAAPAFSGTSAGLAQQAQQDLDFLREQERLARESGDINAARDFQNQIDLLEREQAFVVEQDKATRAFTAEQNRLAEEGALKRNRLGVLSDLIQSFVGAQAQARDTLAGLQPDAFRFAAVAGGIAPFGATPQQGFTEQLQQFAGAPVPQADPNASLPSIESAIQGLTGANVPLSPQVFGAAPQGLAGGGTVPAPFNVMSARLVGEQGPEVMVTSPQGVTILPLGKGAQEGGFFPFEPIEFDKETLLPALGTSGIFGDIGGIPQASVQPFGTFSAFRGTTPFSAHGAGVLGQLGIRPGLLQFGNDPDVFWRDPSGELRHVTGEAFQSAGFNARDVTRFDPDVASRFTFGEALPSNFQVPIPTDRPSPFTRFSAPIVEPTTGTLLPAPFTVARQLNQLRLTNPGAFNLILSAYESAGVPATAVLSGTQAALPFGQERTNIGLR